MSKDIASALKNITFEYTPEDFERMARDSYDKDRKYPENFSNWYPHIVDFGKFAHAGIVATQVFTFEETEVFHKTDDIENVDWQELNTILKPTLDKLNKRKLYSIKNGCFSNKFDFETCITTKSDLAKKLWYINYNSCMFDTGGFTELIVREYIPADIQNTLTIYNGMPLRTEVRVFYNMDTKQIEYMVDYWDYEYCSDGMHNINDKLIFEAFHNKLPLTVGIDNHQEMLDIVKTKIYKDIGSLKFDKELTGIWSIDFMYDKKFDTVYLIDMARGHRSAYWNPDKIRSNINEC